MVGVPATASAQEPVVASASERPRRAAALFVVLVLVAGAWVVLQGFGLGLTPFHTRGEPREAVVVQDLVRHNNWVLPKRNGVQLPRKPPLYYWLAGVAAHMRGTVDEASVRLPSAVLSGIACALVAGVATVLYGGVAGAMAGLTLLTSFEWLRAATAARVDMTLTFGLTLVFVGLLLFRRDERGLWLVMLYAGAAWATLSKGIPGLAIPALQVVLLCAVVDRSLAFAWRIRPVTGLLVVLLVVGAWYAAAAQQGGRDFIAIVVAENFVRAVGERNFNLGHSHSVGYLVGVLAAGLLPWTVFIPSVALTLWRERRGIDRRDPRLFALVWMIAVFAPYAIATSKRGVYLLPLYPAVTLLIGWWAVALVSGSAPSRWLAFGMSLLGWILGVALALLAIAAGSQSVGMPILDTVAQFLDARAAADVSLVAAAAHANRTLALCLAIAAAAAIAMAAAATVRRWGVALACVIICAAGVIVGVRTIILPAIAAADTRRPFAEALKRVVVDPAELYTTAALDYGTLFYWGRAVPVYDRNAGTEPPPYLLMPESTWLALPLAERRRYRRIVGLSGDKAGNQGSVAVLQPNIP